MPIGLQSKLLRVVESREILPVGAATPIKVDVRLIAATNRDLMTEIEAGRFRKDLYYRLKVIPIVLPPLRERTDDIPLLLQHYLTRFNAEFRKNFRRIDDAALQMLVAYAWPGNVRELKNLVERILILEKGDTILPVHLPAEITAAAPVVAATGGAPFVLPTGGVKLEDVENDLVRQALKQADGNQTRAAQLLGISRDSLRYRMQKLASEG